MADDPAPQEKVTTAEDVEKILIRAKALSQRVAQTLRREEAEHDEIGSQVKQLNLAIKEARAKGTGDDEWATQMLDQAGTVLSGQGPGGDLKRFLGVRNPKLLSLLLGQRTCVVAWSTSRSVAIKAEYHSFRMRCSYILAAGSFALLFGFHTAQKLAEANEGVTLAPPLLVGLQLFLVWLLFFYTSMALRENVLMVNGSHIRPWWIQHHYWSVVTCFLLLTLPVDSPVVSKYIRRFLLWTMLQSLVMLLQNRYQRRRMYTRIALGKNNAMDVLGGESSGAFGQLVLLYPLLFALQGLQVWIGIEMICGTWQAVFNPEGWLDLESHESDLWGSRGVFLTGCAMGFMGVQNFRNTVLTITEKRATKTKLIGRVSSAAAATRRASEGGGGSSPATAARAGGGAAEQ